MNIELLDRPEDVTKDWQTLSSYPEHVAVECSCGYHAPPVGLAQNPDSHLETCSFRINSLRNVTFKPLRICDTKQLTKVV